MLAILRGNLSQNGLDERTEVLQGHAEDIPLPDCATDLAISRGSVFFWENLVQAFKEIHRVLTPGGVGYIGGGFGSSKLRETVTRTWQVYKRDPSVWQENMRRNLGPDAPRKYQAALKDAAIRDHEIIHNQEVGLWIVIKKAR
jgi:ubiquinone/menaquinone biosynthesis C-methylase UbiE